MLRASPNLSRDFDVNITPEMIDDADFKRTRWKNSLQTFCEERGHTIARDDVRGAAIVPIKFMPSQIYIDGLINSIAAFNWRRSQALRPDDQSTWSHLPIETVCLKARKVGWSSYFEWRACWLNEFNEGHCALAMAHEKTATRNIVQISDLFLEKWMPENPLERIEVARSSDDLIEWKNRSKIVVMTAGSKGDSSRSFTYHYEHLSELAQYKDDSTELASATTAASKYREIHCESTARGDNLFKELFEKAKWLHEVVAAWENNEPLIDWNGKYKAFFAWHQDDGYRTSLSPTDREYINRTLSQEEKKLLETYDLDLEQIQWRRQKIAGECSDQRENLPEDHFRQEYPANPEEAFIAKGQKAFGQYELSLQERTADDLVKQIAKGNYRPYFMGHMIRDGSSDGGWKLLPMTSFQGSSLVIWEEPEEGQEYLEGVDAAEGLEHRDDSVISIFKRIDPFRIREAARLISKFPPEELGEAAFYLHMLFNEAYIVAERKQPGNATCVKLVKLGCHNMFHFRNVEQFSDRDDPESFTAGFDTNRATKSLIVGYGQSAVRDNLIQLLHPEAIKQWKAYEQEDGKYKAPSGKKDDCVIGDLLCLFGHQPGIAPPIGAYAIHKAKDEVKKSLPPEEMQSAYWQKKLVEIKRRSAEEHKRAEELYYSMREDDEDGNPFGSEVFS